MNIFEKLFGPNWRTTVTGLIGFVSVLVMQIWYHYDNDVDTNFRLDVVLAALSVLTGFKFARDKAVSDQESGIPPARTSQQAYANYERKHGTGDGGIHNV